MRKEVRNIRKVKFFRQKYGKELLIDSGSVESIKNYILTDLPHFLTFYEILIIVEGSGTFSLDETVFDISPNKIIFSSPGNIRCWKLNKSVKAFTLCFEEEFISSFFNDPLFLKRFPFLLSYGSYSGLEISNLDCQKLLTIFHEIDNEIKELSDDSEDMLRALLYQVLVFLNRLYLRVYDTTIHRKSNPYIDKFFELLEEQYLTNQKVGDYAQQLSITPGHLSDLIKEHCGCKTKELLKNRLLLEAKRLLLYSEKTAAEIGYTLSFNDPTYFVRFFKKNTGITPLAFRKESNS